MPYDIIQKPAYSIKVGDSVKLYDRYVRINKVRDLLQHNQVMRTVSQLQHLMAEEEYDNAVTLLRKLRDQLDELVSRKKGLTFLLSAYPGQGWKHCAADQLFSVRVVR